MKHTGIFLALSLLLSYSNTLSAQKTVTWKGGTPGQEQTWNCPKNWSGARVPDAFSDVVIPDVSAGSQALPQIATGTFEANSLRILSNARLTIEQGAQLVVFTMDADSRAADRLLLRGNLLILKDTTDRDLKNGMADKQ